MISQSSHLNGLPTSASQRAVAVAAAYGAVKFLAKRWLEARFAERLEKFKHDQNQEIERLRFRINTLMDRTTKLHQHEFEVLPEVWDKLGKALSEAQSFTSPLTRSYANLDDMGFAEYAEFLANSGLADWQKKELLEGSDRSRRYEQMIFGHRLHQVFISHADFHNYFISRGIFIQSDLKEEIRSLSNMMYDAIAEERRDHETPVLGESRFTKRERLRQEGTDAFQAIEKAVQARLWEANRLE